MTYGPTFYVNKISGTFADALTAYGLAKVLEDVLINSAGPQVARKIMIRDAGPYYTVELPAPLRDEWVENCGFFMPARPIKTPKQLCTGLPDPWGYNAEWERFKQARDTSQTLRQTTSGTRGANPEVQAALDDLRMPPAFSVLTLLGDFRMAALPVYNKLLTQWYNTRTHISLNLKAILDVCSSAGANIDEVAAVWWASVPHDGNDREVTASQLFNPTQGKGQNRTKANALVMGNESSFWLLEFLKAVGLWVCAAPRKISGGDDRKTYVLSPVNLSLGLHQTIFDKFADRLWSDTAVKMDCRAALLYAQALLEYSESDQQDELDFEGYGPENVVAGLHVATYKLLKNYVVLNMAFVGLPHWTGEMKTRARVDELKGVIDEHLRVLQTIDESHSDGYLLLQNYRDFLSGRQWEAFFAFTAGYGQYLMAEWNKSNLRPTQFTTKNLRRLLMSSEARFSEIVENEGFRAIATAIRGSTVIPQYQKARGEKPLYEIRYGLGQELKRKAAYKQEFLTAVGDFLQSYDQENAQKAESQAQRRKNIRTGDIADLVQLVDKFDSEVVCNLLVAFGYARDPKEQPDE